MSKKNTSRLIDKFLDLSKGERAEQPFSHLKKRKDLPEFMPLLIRVLNSSPELGLQFLADPLRFFDDLGIMLSDQIREHFIKIMPSAKKPDRAAYDKVKGGAFKLGHLKSISFDLPPPIVKLLPKLSLAQKDERKLDPADYSNRVKTLIPYGGLKPSVGLFGGAAVPMSLDTGGWDIVMEIKHSFLKELWDLYFYNQFAAAILLKAFSGEEESALIEPWHEFEGWFLVYFRFRFHFDTNDPPEFSLQTGSSSLVKLILRINGTLETRVSASDDWSEPDNFTATVEKFAQPFPKEVGQFAGQTLEDYWAIDLTANSEMTVNVEEYPDDDFFRSLLGLAVDNYFQTEIPELPVTPPIESNPPSLHFDFSQVYNIDNALAIVFGSPVGTPPPTIIKDSNNFALGNSSAQMHHQIRSKFPSLPYWDEDHKVEVKQLGLDLWDGHISLSGSGTYHTGSCSPNVHFNFSVKMYLRIDEHGNLHTEAEEPDVNVSIGVLDTILNALFPLIGLILNSIIEAIVEYLFTEEVGDNINQYLNIAMNVEDMFSHSFGPVTLDVDIPEVEVTRNGVFFHGNMSILES
jgi:hypothetical protein